ncbi:hypothetical protein [Streptomyces sp. NPDC015131]|uniref:hypothetical protein n=1 Tax=Streptomyces sp. NPDC015131 TaxID=3364941 RepID=UPI0036F84E1D
MASLSQIRDAIKATLQSKIPGLHVYDTIPDIVQAPAAVVAPDKANFAVAMACGSDEWDFLIFVMMPRTDVRAAQDHIDPYLTGSGPKSIRQVFFKHSDLGLADGTDCFAKGVEKYGAEYEFGRITYIGAAVRLCVTTPGTA